ncbi:hypothetical protein HanPSC8_Chr11g0492811 [Helianthus annuus]|nr:hypothetical protein HanPSC8_Chr11g0492811 [Helianthus annuus]
MVVRGGGVGGWSVAEDGGGRWLVGRRWWGGGWWELCRGGSGGRHLQTTFVHAPLAAVRTVTVVAAPGCRPPSANLGDVICWYFLLLVFL